MLSSDVFSLLVLGKGSAALGSELIGMDVQIMMYLLLCESQRTVKPNDKAKSRMKPPTTMTRIE